MATSQDSNTNQVMLSEIGFIPTVAHDDLLKCSNNYVNPSAAHVLDEMSTRNREMSMTFKVKFDSSLLLSSIDSIGMEVNSLQLIEGCTNLSEPGRIFMGILNEKVVVNLEISSAHHLFDKMPLNEIHGMAKEFSSCKLIRYRGGRFSAGSRFRMVSMVIFDPGIRELSFLFHRRVHISKWGMKTSAIVIFDPGGLVSLVKADLALLLVVEFIGLLILQG